MICDWLFDVSVKRPHVWALTNESCHGFQIFSPQSEGLASQDYFTSCEYDITTDKCNLTSHNCNFMFHNCNTIPQHNFIYQNVTCNVTSFISFFVLLFCIWCIHTWVSIGRVVSTSLKSFNVWTDGVNARVFDAQIRQRGHLLTIHTLLPSNHEVKWV